ncbi:MAG: ATP-binding protein [Ruminococcus sp.]|nr:ATP-binding protein [Ruminococcus sp.]
MARVLQPYQIIERSIIKKYRKDIWNKFVMGIKEYKMISEGDRIAVCISGGKDSMLLAKCMQHLQKYSDMKFELEFIVMDPGYNPENRQRIIDNAKLMNIPIKMFEARIFNYVVGLEKNPCYMCARMRRGNLYKFAQDLGCNKIALGHHYDDVIETILMGMIYGGQVQTMMPKLHSKNFKGMELIRPLYMVRESFIKDWARYNELKFLQCACRFTEEYEKLENKGDMSKRQEIKELIHKLSQGNDFVVTNIFKSVYNVNLNTVIEYVYKGKRYNFLDKYDEYVWDESGIEETDDEEI